MVFSKNARKLTNFLLLLLLSKYFESILIIFNLFPFFILFFFYFFFSRTRMTLQLNVECAEQISNNSILSAMVNLNNGGLSPIVFFFPFEMFHFV